MRAEKKTITSLNDLGAALGLEEKPVTAPVTPAIADAIEKLHAGEIEAEQVIKASEFTPAEPVSETTVNKVVDVIELSAKTQPVLPAVSPEDFDKIVEVDVTPQAIAERLADSIFEAAQAHSLMRIKSQKAADDIVKNYSEIIRMHLIVCSAFGVKIPSSRPEAVDGWLPILPTSKPSDFTGRELLTAGMYLITTSNALKAELDHCKALVEQHTQAASSRVEEIKTLREQVAQGDNVIAERAKTMASAVISEHDEEMQKLREQINLKLGRFHAEGGHYVLMNVKKSGKFIKLEKGQDKKPKIEEVKVVRKESEATVFSDLRRANRVIKFLDGNRRKLKGKVAVKNYSVARREFLVVESAKE